MAKSRRRQQIPRFYRVLELKRFSPSSPSGASFTTTGYVATITAPIAQGDGIGNRSGDQITVKRLKIRFNAFSLVVGASAAFRVIVFRDTMNQGAIPAPSDVLVTASYQSGYHLANSQQRRYVILYDQMKTVVGGTNQQEVQVDLDFQQNIKVHFLDGTGNPSGMGKNNYFILVIASSTNGSFVWTPEVHYIDA